MTHLIIILAQQHVYIEHLLRELLLRDHELLMLKALLAHLGR